MSKQKRVHIVNIKRSTPGKSVEQYIYEVIWLKNEVKLREQGWFISEEIQEVVTEVVEDGKGLDTIEIVEEVIEEETPVVNTKDSYEDYSIEELKKACDDKGISYHHASKSKKLISLLEA